MARWQLDDEGMRTMMRGLTVGLAIYAAGFVAPYLIEGGAGEWISIVLTALSLLFMLGWTIATFRGYRVGKKSRGERRAAKHRKEEREKRARMR